MLVSGLIIAAAYVWGSIPSAYLVGRHRKGVDLRDYGSGNVGASNLMALAGRKTGLLLGVFDSLGKGMLPVLLAKLLDQSFEVQMWVGIVSIVGHNWSPFIRFTGGRGVATTIGVVVGFFMWREVLLLTVVLGLLGRVVFNEFGFWTLVAMVLLPVLAFVFGQPAELVYFGIGSAVLLMFKRLTANWEAPRGGYHPLMVLAYRALWDRDVPKRVQWVQRRPPADRRGSSTDVPDEVLS